MQNKILIPDEVKIALNKLEQNGFEAHIVSGCIRDSLIGRIPADWDVATNALPVEIKGLFDKTIDTGIKYGTFTILIGSMSIEVTTYRVDGKYEDNRHPSDVRFSNSLIEDLSRRDFTINSIAYNPVYGFCDPFGGKCDIDAKLIRTVGDADERFHEDALRMLRCIRFSAQLEYNIHPETMESICENSKLIIKISSERIRDELTGVMMSDNPDKFLLLEKTGLLQHIIPEFSYSGGEMPVTAHDDIVMDFAESVYDAKGYTCDIETVVRALKLIDKESRLRWAVLIGGLMKVYGNFTNNETKGIYTQVDQTDTVQKTKNLLRRLKFDNKNVQRITTLVKYAGVYIEPSFKSVMKIAALTGKAVFEDLLKVKISFIQAGNLIKSACNQINSENELNNEIEFNNIQKIYEIYKGIIKYNYCLSFECLAVNGHDIMDIGVSDDKTVGAVLKRLLEAVMDQPELNERVDLIKLARTIFKEFA